MLLRLCNFLSKRLMLFARNEQPLLGVPGHEPHKRRREVKSSPGSQAAREKPRP